MRKVVDAASLEASLLQQQQQQRQRPNYSEDSEVIEFDDELCDDSSFARETHNSAAAVVMPGAKFSSKKTTTTTTTTNTAPLSYVETCSVATPNSPPPPVSKGRSVMTVEELEARLANGMTVGPHSPVSQLVGAGPPPGLVTSPKSAAAAPPGGTLLPGLAPPSSALPTTSSTAPLPQDDPNRGFMNRFERELIQRIHTHQLTTDNPHMDDFYYQSLTKKRAAASGSTANAAPPLLYFPLPSVADREREYQRRQQRRARREQELAAKEGRFPTEAAAAAAAAAAQVKTSSKESSGEALELVLGKVSHSSSRKPRQQLQIPSSFAEEESKEVLVSLHERILKSTEAVYAAVLSVEDVYLRAESAAVERGDGSVSREEVEQLPEFAQAQRAAQEQIVQELGLDSPLPSPVTASTAAAAEADHEFIHFLTIPKGKAILPRALQLISAEHRERFLLKLIEYFDFLDVVRPETPVPTTDAFISCVLSPLVAFVGEAEWNTVLMALRAIFAKRSFVWIALTKAGMVLLCILLSRVEILKSATGADEASIGAEMEDAAKLTERIFDALEGHLMELFTVRVADNREFYAWQFLALLAMNVDSDRKRNMIMELRDQILFIVESGDEKAINNLNVFLNALGLDASQLS